jgi:predicted component of type VI protein secretion system
MTPHENELKPQEALVSLVQMTDSFIASEELHNERDIAVFVKKRRRLIASLHGDFSSGISPEIRINLAQRIEEQGRVLSEIIKKLQSSIKVKIDEMNYSKMVFRRYKSQRMKPSRFIDRKR